MHCQTSVLLNAAQKTRGVEPVLVSCYIGPALGQRLMFAGSADKPHCVSHITVVPKRNNKFCFIQNLRPARVVNDSCCKETFQCEENC